MNKTKYEGLRYIALPRCSTLGQADTSIDDQLGVIHAFGRAHQMIPVGEMLLPGLTGSIPGLRQDIDELVKRKRERNDFDCVLIQDSDRMSRAGTMHGASVEYRLRSEGIRIICVSDDLPEGEDGDVIRMMRYYAAHKQVEGIAYASTRGCSAAMHAGKAAHTHRSPYGIDRLYLAEDGTPRHIIRSLPDGTQQKLAPTTGVVLETYGQNSRHGAREHYIKQKQERVEMVPGDPKCVDVVRLIFRKHDIEKWGTYTIALHLNDTGILSATGRSWTSTTVRCILDNPIYLGLGLCNVTTRAIYYMRGKDAPVKSPVELKDIARGRPSKRVRDRADWFERAEPHLEHLLDEDVKAAAMERLRLRLDRLAGNPGPRPNRDRHHQSLFICKGIATTKQGGYPLTGRYEGSKHCRCRYYGVSKAIHSPISDDGVLRRRIPAEPLESAVLSALRVVVANREGVRRRIKEIVARERRSSTDGPRRIDILTAERKTIEAKIEFIVEDLDRVGRDAAKRKLQQLQDRLRAIDSEMRSLAREKAAPSDPDAIVDTVMQQLARLDSSLPPPQVREVLRSLVASLVVDLEDRNAELKLAIPDWAEITPDDVSLVAGSESRTCYEAKQLDGAVYWAFRLIWDTSARVYRVEAA